jgi:Trk K+ transport system NAD-binding subunit
MAVVAMGLAMQRGAFPEERRLRRFKEQLTVLGISLLFVLLSANLPLGLVKDEGYGGWWTVVALMVIVRPANVWLSLRGTDLSWRELAFISWIAPRGIVAASVASLFALELTEAGIGEGQRVLALAFLTIAMTVTIQGLTAPLVARALRLETLLGRRVIVIGAGPVALQLADVLRRYDRPVAVVDRNAELVEEAQRLGFEAVCGNALDESVLANAGTEEAETIVAMTTNPEVNTLAAQVARDTFGVAMTYPVFANPARGANARILEQTGGAAAFGRSVDLAEWDHAVKHDRAHVIAFRVPAGVNERARLESLPDTMVALARARQQSVEIATADQTWRANDTVMVLTTMTDADAVSLLDRLVRA